MTFLVRATGGDPMRLVPSFRAAVAAVDRTAPISQIKTAEDYFAEQLQAPRQFMALLSFFSSLAVARFLQ